MEELNKNIEGLPMGDPVDQFLNTSKPPAEDKPLPLEPAADAVAEFINTPNEEKQSGFLPALKSGAQNYYGNIVGGTKAGVSAFTGDMEGIQEGADIVERQSKKASENFSAMSYQDVGQALKDGDPEEFLSRLGTFINEQIGQSAPYMAAPIAASSATIKATKNPVLAAGAGIAAGTAQFFGMNISRQLEEGTPIEDIDPASALAAAPVQGSLDYLLLAITGGMGKSIANKEINNILGDLLKGTGKGIVTEVPTEVSQQIIERYQAGLDITSDEAFNEYKAAAAGAAAAGGPIGGVIEATSATKVDPVDEFINTTETITEPTNIEVSEELESGIKEEKLLLSSESWRTKLSTATRPEIIIKTEAQQQTLSDIDKKPLTDIPDNIKDVLPFTGNNKDSFAAGLDSLIDAGMPRLLLNSVKQFGQMPSENRSGVTYPDQGIIAINQKELADANKGEANARWSVTSLLAHELGHIPDAINRMPEFNDQNLSNELLSWSSEYFWNQDLALNELENIKLNAEFIENFGPITQEAYNIYRNDIEGYSEFLGYPFDSLMTSINEASTGVTGPIKTLVGEVQAQMSALYRINPELLAKHAPEAYKFYKGLDNELNTEKTASPESAKKIRRHFRSSSPTRGTQSLQFGETSRDGRGGPDEGGALYGMGAEGQNENRLDNGRLVRYDATKVKPSGGSAGTVITVKDLAEYFTKEHNQRHKKRKLDVSKTRDKNIVIDKGVADLEFQMTQDITGKGWYDQDIADAIEITSEIIPELKTVKHMPSLLLVVAGVTSPASEVPMNWQVATEVMMNYVKDGVFPRVKTADSFSGNPNTAWDPRGSSKKALDFMNWLVDRYGEAGAAKYLLTEHKIKDLRKIKIDSGVYTSHGIAGNQDTETLGATIFGPKVGAFIANLHGVEDVTIDLWMTKAHNRHTGKLLEGNVGSDGTVSTPRNDTERKLMQEWVYNVADKTGNTARDAQAILWFYEQYLYRSLGIKAEPKGFSDGAKQIVNKIVTR